MNDWTALRWAVHIINIPTIKMLLEHSANTEATNKEGRTILYQAIQADSSLLVQLLVEDGANIEALERYRKTPIYWTIGHDNLILTEILLKQGANLGARSDWGKTPLHGAVIGGNIRMVKLLLQFGADPCTKATNSIEGVFRSLVGGRGTIRRGCNERNRYEVPDPNRDEIKIVLKEAEKAWKLSVNNTHR